MAPPEYPNVAAMGCDRLITVNLSLGATKDLNGSFLLIHLDPDHWDAV